MRAPILQLTARGKRKLHWMLSVPMALAAVAAGIFFFLKLGSYERAYNAKMQRIQAGEVKPEILTIVAKSTSGDGEGGSRYYVTLQSSNESSFTVSVPRECYDLIQAADRSVAYRFPDGYFIPQFCLGGWQMGQWLFLGGGLFVAAIFLAEPFFTYRTRRSDVAS